MKKRTTCPKKVKYYITQNTGGLNGAVQGSPTQPFANVLDNCVGYANGRFSEIINDPDLKGIVKAMPFQLVCNAENFIEAAKRQGLKISKTPTLGGIMVWQKGSTLGGGDGAGHVAVVEQINDDGSIVTSESGWASWAFKLVHRTNANGRWGQNELYKFRGCIINPKIGGGTIPTEDPLVVDGIGGGMTVMVLQRFFNQVEDGIISGQQSNLSKWYPALEAVEYVGKPSPTVKAMQKWLSITDDGIWGYNTSKSLQRYLKKEGLYTGEVDGIFGKNSMKALQSFLNEQIYHVKPKKPSQPEKPPNDGYLVVDVSEFQSKIDWKKAKADGVRGVIVRCGYRGYEKGTLKQDSMFLDHINGAHKAGLKIGVYFFTEAINGKEGKEEAVYTLNLIKKLGLPLDYPIAIDTEYINANARANNLSVAKRTEAINGFCSEIEKQGYKAMIYGSTDWLNKKLDMSKLPYDVWVAQYYKECQYKGKYVLWQYTSDGHIDGVKGVIDLNHCYIK